MNKTEQIKLINRAFSALPDMVQGWTDRRDVLIDITEQSERRYRQGRPDSMRCGISVKVAARLFTVKNIADTLAGERRYNITDLLSIRHECLYAQAVALTWAQEIRAAWQAAKINLADLTALDYAALMQEGRA